MSNMKNHSDAERQAIEDAQADLCRAFLAMNNVDECRNLLLDLCTPAELEVMIDRWRVVALLAKERPYREISELTGVSVTTIGRVSRALDYGSGGYKMAYRRSVDENGR